MTITIIDEEKVFMSVKRLREKFPDEEIFIVLYDRVSTPMQKKNLEAREAVLRAKCARYGLIVIAYFAEVANGKSDRLFERDKLREAATFALENEAILVFPCVNRLVRTAGEFDDPLTDDDMRPLKTFFMNMGMNRDHLAFLVPPGTPAEEVNGLLKEWGQAGKGNKGGRPKKAHPGKKKEFREKYLPIVKEMWESGHTIDGIVEKLLLERGTKAKRSTIGDWVKSFQKGS